MSFNDTISTEVSSGRESGELSSETPRPQQYILRRATDPNKYRPDVNIWDSNEVHLVLNQWKPQSEMWIYRWGLGMLAFGSSASAVYVNYHFRHTLYLLTSSRVSSYLAMVAIPGFAAAVLHDLLVRTPLLNQVNERNRGIGSCSVCLQVKGMAIQGITGVAYPLLLVPFICYPVARSLKSYTVPRLDWRNPWPVIHFTREMLKPIKAPLWTIGALQVLLGMYVTYQQQVTYAEKVLPHLLQKKAALSPFDHRYGTN